MKLYELQSPAEVTALEQYLDDLMRPVGLDVAFSRHFIERLLGRERRVTIPEIVDAFTKLKKKYKQKLKSAKKQTGYEAVLKDLDNDLNLAFSIGPGPNLPQLINITIMRKDPNKFVPNVRGGEVLTVGKR